MFSKSEGHIAFDYMCIRPSVYPHLPRLQDMSYTIIATTLELDQLT